MYSKYNVAHTETLNPYSNSKGLFSVRDISILGLKIGPKATMPGIYIEVRKYSPHNEEKKAQVR